MTILEAGGLRLELLAEKAVYWEAQRSLLVADVHLGKSETFQHFGVPISSQVNQVTLERLRGLCQRFQPEVLWILGDLFHSQAGMVDEVLDGWLQFLHEVQVDARLILGNHDRALISTLSQLSIECFTAAVAVDGLILSHEPYPDNSDLNICGHVHPCLNLSTRLDHLRLPCFHWQSEHQRLTLPSFGEFTGGYEVRLTGEAVAYAIAEDQLIPFSQSAREY